MPFLLLQIEKKKTFFRNLIFASIVLLIALTVLNTGWYHSYNVVTSSEISGRLFLTQHEELEILNKWAPQNVYIKRITNFVKLRGERVEGYLEDVDNKQPIYDNGNFIIYQ